MAHFMTVELALCVLPAQFGSSSQAVFFKMRVAGVLHIFQFDTRQGEDICMALQTHINDIMMKRYSKARLTWLLLLAAYLLSHPRLILLAVIDSLCSWLIAS